MSTRRARAKVAQAYLEYLYSDAAQKIIASELLPPGQARAADPKDLKRFPK